MSKWVHRTVLTAAMIGSAIPSLAQQSVKILTPNSDSCAAFTRALNTNEEPLLLALGG